MKIEFIYKKVLLTLKNGTFWEHVRLFVKNTISNVKIKKRLVVFLGQKYWNYIDPKKIVVCNFFGKGYGCNPKYIVEELLARNVDCKITWLVKDRQAKKTLPPGIKPVKYLSLAAFRELMTAKIWINNQLLSSYIRRGLYKKEGQFYIQTYHGSFGIKRIGERRKDAKNINFDTSKKHAQMIDVLLSNSEFETEEMYKPYFYGCGTIYPFGHPRNDMFFAPDIKERRAKIKQSLGLAADTKVALYIPTYRKLEELDCYKLDYDRISAAFRKRFGGEWAFLVRLHPVMLPGLRQALLKNHKVMDVTNYSDTQELLLIADAAVTDYSSAILDYMLGDGVGFIFAKDYVNYDSDWGFCYPLTDTPFPLAVNNDELEANILNFDIESYRVNVKKFLEGKGCIEDGNASKRVVDIIEKKLGENVQL